MKQFLLFVYLFTGQRSKRRRFTEVERSCTFHIKYERESFDDLREI